MGKTKNNSLKPSSKMAAVPGGLWGASWNSSSLNNYWNGGSGGGCQQLLFKSGGGAALLPLAEKQCYWDQSHCCMVDKSYWEQPEIHTSILLLDLSGCDHQAGRYPDGMAKREKVNLRWKYCPLAESFRGTRHFAAIMTSNGLIMVMGSKCLDY